MICIWFVGWLVGRLRVGLLVGWVDDWLVGWLRRVDVAHEQPQGENTTGFGANRNRLLIRSG